jgi:hypothetical protein
MENYSTSEGIANYHEYDVVYGGKGRTIWTKTNGWKKYRSLIRQHMLEYKTLSVSKSEFAFQNVVKPILDLGGNFFVPGSSEPLTEKKILYKVTQAFRDSKFMPSTTITSKKTMANESQSHFLNYSPLCINNHPPMLVTENGSIGKLPPPMMLQPIHEEIQEPRNMKAASRNKRRRSLSFSEIQLRNMNVPFESELKRSRSYEDSMVRSMSHFLISSPPRTIAEMSTIPLIIPNETLDSFLGINDQDEEAPINMGICYEDEEMLKKELPCLAPNSAGSIKVQSQHQILFDEI